MEEVMRIRRTILAPAILAAGAASALIVAPIAAFVTPAAASPQLTVYHASAGTVAPNLVVMHA